MKPPPSELCWATDFTTPEIFQPTIQGFGKGEHRDAQVDGAWCG